MFEARLSFFPKYSTKDTGEQRMASILHPPLQLAKSEKNELLNWIVLFIGNNGRLYVSQIYE